MGINRSYEQANNKRGAEEIRNLVLFLNETTGKQRKTVYKGETDHDHLW